MSLQGKYEPDNIFAKILKGDIPSIRVFEDEIALAFLDIFPQVEGHTLVIPKTSSRNFLDFPSELLGDYIKRVQTVTQAVTRAFSPEGVRIMQFNGAPAGQTVFHLHFHILPIFEGERMKAHASGEQADPAHLEILAERIRNAF